MTAPVDTNFVSGTTITSNWLNGVNDAINNSTQDISGSVPRTILKKVSDNISVKDFGAVGDGVTDDTTAIDTAHLETDGAVRYPYQSGEVYVGDDTLYNLYGNSIHTRALGEYIQAGRKASPTEAAQPIHWVQKYSAANRDTVAGNWDQVGYYGLIKKDGDAYGAALTGYGLYSGGSGDLVGIHGRVTTQTDNSRSYAGWFYVNVETANPTAAHGIEIDGRNTVADQGWGSNLNLLILGTTDHPYDVNRFGTGIKMIQVDSRVNGGFWTGLHIAKNSIVETTGSLDDGEAILLGGADKGSIGGIRLNEGTFKFALRTDEAAFVNNTAIFLGNGQRIRWTDLSTGPNIVGGGNSFTLSNSYMNIANPVSDTAVQVASTKVLGARKTGWTAAAGTATRTQFATSTVTVSQLAERVKALLDDLISHGLIGT